MRLGAFVLAAGVLAGPVLAIGQEYAGDFNRETNSVLRPATTVGWRNYMAVPDGPCGPPMSVQTDCYVGCRPCGPLRPICFLKRVGRMFDCLLPCNLCCRSGCGGCGHGCLLGRRLGCNVCCGGQAGCGCGGGGCCPNPCGSVFDNCSTPSCSSCTTGGHCYGCGSALPGLSDPFRDDPMPPKPTAEPATEVRRVPARPARPVSTPARVTTAAAPKKASPYKIVAAPPATQLRAAKASATATTSKKSGTPVLRQASAEQSFYEPAEFKVDRARTLPIVRSQSPESESDVPVNPLR